MANGLKYGTSDLTALQFDAPYVIADHRFDFTEWSFNSTEQPVGGITVEEGRIVITKFKPNVPILTSAFTGTGNDNTPISSEICTQSKLIKATVSGFSDNTSFFTNFAEPNIRRPWGDVNLKGIWFGPFYTYNSKVLPITVDMSLVDGAVITYSDGTLGEVGSDNILRGTGNGYGYFYHTTDKIDTFTPDWVDFPGPTNGVNAYWQLAIVLFTGYTPDNDGFITLSSPITIKIENPFIVNPTSIESYRAAMGSSSVYNKAMTFANVLQRHGCAFKEVGTYTEPIMGINETIQSHYGNEANTAFVITERSYRNLYDNMRLPAISDLGTLIQQNFPFKFWATLKRDSDYSHIWDSLVTAFGSNAITDEKFATHLFAKSQGYIEELTLIFDVGNNGYIDMSSIMDCSSLVDSLYINITTGILKSLHNCFRQCRSLTAVSFNQLVHVSEWHGAFEGCSLQNFPINLAPRNEWDSYTGTGTSALPSEPTCHIQYATDGGDLTVFGDYINTSIEDLSTVDYEVVDQRTYYVLRVSPICFGAFRNSNLTQIRFVLDMKFIEPVYGNIVDDGSDVINNNAIFYAPNLTVAYIKNLNKGDWSLDGVKRPDKNNNSIYAGNLVQYDEDSANYLLSNLFDLRLNSDASQEQFFQNARNSFNTWSMSNGTKESIAVHINQSGATLTNNLASAGTMYVTLELTNCICTVTSGGTSTTYASGDRDIPLSTGACSIVFTKDNSGIDAFGAVITIREGYRFKAELTRNLTSANIYLPQDWDDRAIIHADALAEANSRGWTVYVGGVEYTV